MTGIFVKFECRLMSERLVCQSLAVLASISPSLNTLYCQSHLPITSARQNRQQAILALVSRIAQRHLALVSFVGSDSNQVQSGLQDAFAQVDAV